MRADVEDGPRAERLRDQPEFLHVRAVRRPILFSSHRRMYGGVVNEPHWSRELHPLLLDSGLKCVAGVSVREINNLALRVTWPGANVAGFGWHILQRYRRGRIRRALGDRHHGAAGNVSADIHSPRFEQAADLIVLLLSRALVRAGDVGDAEVSNQFVV